MIIMIFDGVHHRFDLKNKNYNDDDHRNNSNNEFSVWYVGSIYVGNWKHDGNEKVPLRVCDWLISAAMNNMNKIFLCGCLYGNDEKEEEEEEEEEEEYDDQHDDVIT